MNERIQELAEQAEDWADKQNFYESDYRDYFNKKFAELIVRECQERVEHYIRDCGEIGSLPDTVIMKHFGVEQ